jgi:hypothetical protein
MARVTMDLQDFIADPLDRRTHPQGRMVGRPDRTTVVVSYAAVRELLGDRASPRTSSSFYAPSASARPFYEWMAMSPSTKDGEVHLRWRLGVAHLHMAGSSRSGPSGARP